MQNVTCIMCPIGCQIEVEKIGENFNVTGNQCLRGKNYAIAEITAPKRMITTLAVLNSGDVVPCKTSDLIDKKLIFDILKVIKCKRFAPPILIGDVLIKNVLNTGADIIATGDIDEINN